MFVSWLLEPVQVNKMTLKLYLVVNLTMKPPDCAHVFQMNKTALAMPGIDHCLMLDTLGAQLNLSAIVSGVLGDWNHHFCCNWCNFANLMILSYHIDGGAQVNNTTTANDSAILLPVINGPTTACWKQHICFVCVQMNQDFLSLVTVDPPGVTVLGVKFDFKLPQETRDMNNSREAYCLTTYFDCPPFKIDFCRAMKSIPANAEDATTTHYIDSRMCTTFYRKPMPVLLLICKRNSFANES
jgi:hypothetical protein